MKSMLLLAALVLTAACAWSEDQPVKISTLNMKDGTSVKCVKVSTMEADGVTLYSVTKLDGKKSQYSGDDVKSVTTETVDLSTLPEAAQKALAKAAPAKPADAPAAAPDAADEARKLAAKSYPEIADEKKKYDAAVDAIMEEGRKAVADQTPLDAAAKTVDDKFNNIDTLYNQAQQQAGNPLLRGSEKAAATARLNSLTAQRTALLQQKTDADKAAADQDQKVNNLVATKDKKIADLKAKYDAKVAEIKAKYAAKDTKDSKDAAATDTAVKEEKK